MSHRLLEKYVQVVRMDGLNTNKAATFGSTVAVTGALTTAAGVRSTTSTALAASGNAALDPTLGSVFTLTPTASQNITASSAPVGAVVYLVVTTSGTSSYTQTFTTNFKTTGTLATGTVSGKVFTITFVGDGTNMNEVARTTAM